MLCGKPSATKSMKKTLEDPKATRWKSVGPELSSCGRASLPTSRPLALNYGYFGICYNSTSDILIRIEGKTQQCQYYNFLKI